MLFEQEAIGAAMTLVSYWIPQYGIPQALYCDHKRTSVSNREPRIEEQLAGIEPQSHVEQAFGKREIPLIAVNRPQAKGMVERTHAVYQDRVVKELHPVGISAIEQAKRFPGAVLA
jgi:hypothetical protein